MAPLTKRHRESGSSDDERPRKSAKFEARDHFLLMLERKKQKVEERKSKRREQTDDVLKTYRAIISVRGIQNSA